MPKHKDFQKIFKRFISQFGEEKGKKLYFAWLNKRGLDDTKSLSSQKDSKETKERNCVVQGFELKESEKEYHINGFIATTHVDQYDEEPMAAGIPDRIPKATLDEWCGNINTGIGTICGIHHSEGRTGHYGAEADYQNTPAVVYELPDGEYGLFVDTKVLKDDPVGMKIVDGFQNGDLNSFSVTYDTQGMQTVDFEFINDRMTRIINPGTRLFGYTAASNPVNQMALAVDYGFKEFKEFHSQTTDKVVSENKIQGANKMSEQDIEYKAMLEKTQATNAALQNKLDAMEAKEKEAKAKADAVAAFKESPEFKELVAESQKRAIAEHLGSEEFKEKLDSMAKDAGFIKHDGSDSKPEFKAFSKMFEEKELSAAQGFRVAGEVADANKLFNGMEYKATAPIVTGKPLPQFATNGSKLEFKGLGLGDNVNSNYVNATSGVGISQAELDDVYNPAIWNLLNQETTTWNFLMKDDFSASGNNHVQFRVKTGVNATRGFYTGNEVNTGRGPRTKYQTKFKKCSVGIEIDGDMIAANNGASVGSVWNIEIQSATEDLLELMNVALFQENGAETGANPIGMPYITDIAGNTSLYSTARTFANGLAPSSAGDTYRDGSGGLSYALLQGMIDYVGTDGSKKSDLFFVCDYAKASLIRQLMISERRYNGPNDTVFGFVTDLEVNGIPVLVDADCKENSIFLVDAKHFRIGMWVPPRLEMLGKRADADEAFIKSYYATYSTAPRRMVELYDVTAVAS